MCVRMCSTAMFCFAVSIRVAVKLQAPHWTESAHHHPAATTTQAAQTTALALFRIRRLGRTACSTTDLPSIGAEPGVAATLQNCGVRRTNLTTAIRQCWLSDSPQHFLLKDIHPSVGIEYSKIPSFGRAYISSRRSRIANSCSNACR